MGCTQSDSNDIANMEAALALARRGLGRVWPNPAVGCVLVEGTADGHVVGRGWTQPDGRPHAETEALRRAGDAARGAVAYITLEPCDHHGQTPPCTTALVDAGIGRYVIAVLDPDPRVSGSGVARLEAAGVPVATGVCAEPAEALNAGFFLRITEGRPLFTVKTATTLDGRIATRSGESRWITGEPARALVHGLRAGHDAVMIGSATAIEDDPQLTCRLPGMEERSPIRIVADSRLRLPLTSRLVEAAASVPVWLLTIEDADATRRQAYTAAGVEVIAAPGDEDGAPDLAWAAQEFARRGLTRVLVEGGGRLSAALLRRGLVDRLAWFRAPRLIGGDGVPAAATLGVDHLSDTPRFELVSTQPAGTDVLETYVRADQ